MLQLVARCCFEQHNIQRQSLLIGRRRVCGIRPEQTFSIWEPGVLFQSKIQHAYEANKSCQGSWSGIADNLRIRKREQQLGHHKAHRSQLKGGIGYQQHTQTLVGDDIYAAVAPRWE